MESGLRTAHLQRETSESSVDLRLDLDGTGRSSIATTVPFFDHMLTAFAKHSLTDLTVTANGDVEIDVHHTVEDTGIVLGTAVRQALGDKAGIARFGDATVPLDEALAMAVVDISGRPYLVHSGEPAGFEYHLIGGTLPRSVGGPLLRGPRCAGASLLRGADVRGGAHGAPPGARGAGSAPHRGGPVQGVRPRVPGGEG